MADGAPVTSAELAERTGTEERYVREWLSAQAAGGYVTYDAESGSFTLPPEQAMALAQDDSPAFIPGAFQLAASLVKDEAKIAEAFRTGDGVGWHEHDGDLFCGTERFFRPGYIANLVPNWIPALVGDVGCGHGASTLILAEAYPQSRFVGYDYHSESIDRARAGARAAGVEDRVSFEVASAKDFPGEGYDLVAMFDCLHDMGDPVGAAAHVREALTEDG